MKIVIEPPRQVMLHGQLDSKGAGQIYDELVAFCRNSTAKVTLDMRGVESCTRAGCGVIFVAAKLLQRNGVRLQITHAPSATLKMISARGFEHLLTFEACPGNHGKQLEQFGSPFSPLPRNLALLEGHLS
mgnify:CR=1 FL=1